MYSMHKFLEQFNSLSTAGQSMLMSSCVFNLLCWLACGSLGTDQEEFWSQLELLAIKTLIPPCCFLAVSGIACDKSHTMY